MQESGVSTAFSHEDLKMDSWVDFLHVHRALLICTKVCSAESDAFAHPSASPPRMLSVASTGGDGGGAMDLPLERLIRSMGTPPGSFWVLSEI